VVVLKGRVELVGPMDPTAIDDHHDLFAALAERRHDLMTLSVITSGDSIRHWAIRPQRSVFRFVPIADYLNSRSFLS